MEFFHPKLFFVQIVQALVQASRGNDVALLTMTGAIMVCGGMYAFFGYRLYRWVLVILGLGAGVALGATITDLLAVPQENRPYLMLALSGILGLVGAFVAPKLFNLFTFAFGGCAIALALAPLAKAIAPPYNWLVLVIAFAAGGGLAFLLMRPTLIIATSIAGSYILSVTLLLAATQLKILDKHFNFLLFYGVWFLLGVFACTSQFQQKTPSELDRLT